MPDSYQIHILNDIVTVDFNRSPSVDEFLSAIDETARYEANQFRLWDLSCGLTWSAEQIEDVAKYAKSKFRTPLSKVAIVAPDHLTFGLFRIHDVYREDGLLEQVVFRTREEAVQWLEQKRTFSGMNKSRQ